MANGIVVRQAPANDAINACLKASCQVSNTNAWLCPGISLRAHLKINDLGRLSNSFFLSRETYGYRDVQFLRAKQHNTKGRHIFLRVG